MARKDVTVPRRTTGLAVWAAALVAVSATAVVARSFGLRDIVTQEALLATPAAVIVYLLWLSAVRHNAELRVPGTVGSDGYMMLEYVLPVINLFAPAQTLLRMGRTATSRPVPRTLVIAWAVAWNARLLSYVPVLAPVRPYAMAAAGVLCVLMIAAVERAGRAPVTVAPVVAVDGGQALGTVS